jgi:hypothetical protein
LQTDPGSTPRIEVITKDKTPQHIKLDKLTPVEKPLFDRFAGLGWEIIGLDSKQQSSKAFVLPKTEEYFVRKRHYLFSQNMILEGALVIISRCMVEFFRKLTYFDASPSVRKLAGLMWTALWS